MRGPDPSFIDAAERYPIAAPKTGDARGTELRAARRQLGLKLGNAARILAIPVTKLLEVEWGLKRFRDAGDYERAAQNLRTGAARQSADRRSA